jgi:hypothetical protein
MPKRERLLGPLVTATEVEAHWDHCLVTISDGRRLKLPYDYHETIDDASPYERMAVTLAQAGHWVVWPALNIAFDVWRLVEDAEIGHAPWGDPPTFEGAW